MAQPATVITDETTEVTKASVFHAWSDLLNLADNWSTGPCIDELESIIDTSPSSVSYGYGISPTSLVLSSKRVHDAAAWWKNISEISPSRSGIVLRLTTIPFSPQFPIFRLKDSAAINFCARHSIFFESLRYHAAILDQFDNVKSIEVEISRDHEIEDYEKLRFRVVLADEIDKIITEEDGFGDYVQRLFSSETLSNFTMTLEIADGR